MKKGHIRLLIICFLLISFFMINGFLSILNPFTLALTLFLITAGLYYYLGYEKDTKKFRKETMWTVINFTLAYYIITYLLGLVTGFYRSIYDLSILSIFNNTIPIILIIILSELTRYMIITKGSNYKSIQILTVVVFTIIEMLLFIASFSSITIMHIISIIIPIIAKNILLTYLASKVGYRSAILYRALFELPIYILPIFPNFGIYIGSIVRTISPIILMSIIYYEFLKVKPKQIIAKKKGKIGIISFASICVILFFIVSLTSGWFRYHAIVIGSGSMRPTINEGDVIIVRRLNDREISTLQEGDILVFNHNGDMVAHRIVRKVQLNNEYFFYTKGDNNTSEDGYPVEVADVIGRVSFRIPVIGYPTLWLSRMAQ